MLDRVSQVVPERRSIFISTTFLGSVRPPVQSIRMARNHTLVVEIDLERTSWLLDRACEAHRPRRGFISYPPPKMILAFPTILGCLIDRDIEGGSNSSFSSTNRTQLAATLQPLAVQKSPLAGS